MVDVLDAAEILSRGEQCCEYSQPALCEVLYCSALGARSLGSLAGFERVHTVYLSDNSLENLDGVALPALRFLYARRNRIACVAGVRALKHLAHLDLEGNQVSDATPLLDCPSLESINLNSNELRDPSQVSALLALPKLQTLLVKNNRLDFGGPETLTWEEAGADARWRAVDLLRALQADWLGVEESAFQELRRLGGWGLRPGERRPRGDDAMPTRPGTPARAASRPETRGAQAPGALGAGSDSDKSRRPVPGAYGDGGKRPTEEEEWAHVPLPPLRGDPALAKLPWGGLEPPVHGDNLAGGWATTGTPVCSDDELGCGVRGSDLVDREGVHGVTSDATTPVGLATRSGCREGVTEGGGTRGKDQQDGANQDRVTSDGSTPGGALQEATSSPTWSYKTPHPRPLSIARFEGIVHSNGRGFLPRARMHLPEPEAPPTPVHERQYLQATGLDARTLANPLLQELALALRSSGVRTFAVAGNAGLARLPRYETALLAAATLRTLNDNLVMDAARIRALAYAVEGRYLQTYALKLLQALFRHDMLHRTKQYRQNLGGPP